MKLVAALATIAALSLAAPAGAHRHGGRDDGSAQASHAIISQERALEIAREQGVATVREVKLDDGNWKVEGRTESGREIEVEIDAHSGAVVKRELY